MVVIDVGCPQCCVDSKQFHCLCRCPEYMLCPAGDDDHSARSMFQPQLKGETMAKTTLGRSSSASGQLVIRSNVISANISHVGGVVNL